MRQFLTEGPGNVGALAPPIADYVNQYVFDGTNAVKITWPVNAVAMNISAPSMGTLYTRAGGTAVVPSGAITDGTGSALAVAQRQRHSSENQFSMISSSAQTATIEFWGG